MMTEPYWEPLAAAPAQFSPKITTAPISSGPPASPVHGDIWIATNIDTSGAVWQFVYNAASSHAYKWEFIGGSPWLALDGGSTTLAQTGIWTYVNTPATDFIAPRSGDYRAETEAQFGVPTANQQCFIGVANASLSLNPQQGQWGQLVGNYDTLHVATGVIAVTAAQTLRPVYNVPVANIAVAGRGLKVWPKRIT